jgi:hypothetical protein
MPKLETAVWLSLAECEQAILVAHNARPKPFSATFHPSGTVTVGATLACEEVKALLVEHAKRLANIKGACSSSCRFESDDGQEITGADIRFANVKPN